MPLRTAVLTFLAATCLAFAARSSADPAWTTELTIDGVPTAVEEHYVHEDLATALDACETQWQAEYPGEPVRRSTVRQWHVLGQRAGVRYRTAQFAPVPDGGTRVLLASRSMHPGPAAPRSTVPLPVAAQTLRTVSSRAGSRLATQTYAISAQSAPATLAAFESLIVRSGWRQDSPAAAAAAGAAGAAAAATRVSAWRRGDEELLAVVAEGPPTTLLIHHVRPASAVQERP